MQTMRGCKMHRSKSKAIPYILSTATEEGMEKIHEEEIVAINNKTELSGHERIIVTAVTMRT